MNTLIGVTTLFFYLIVEVSPISATEVNREIALHANQESALHVNQENALQEGLEAEAKGDYRQALDIWERAATQSDRFDAAIGFEYIRLATEQRMTDAYVTASDLYLRSLSNAANPAYRETVRDELERLRPLAGVGMHRQWVSWLESGDPKLGVDLIAFWVQSDPVPTDLYNERLIEHWERIAEARAHYQKQSLMPYGADGRASVYVRYGSPDQIKSGSLKVDAEFTGNWLTWQFEHTLGQRADTMATPDRFSDGSEAVEDLQSFLLPFHEYPEYEIWIYHSVTTYRGEPLIFIFGTDGQTGEFRRLGSIDETIPRRAFGERGIQAGTVRDSKMGSLTPALLLQMVYYQQLAGLDPWFRYRLVSIRDAYLDQAHFGSSENLDQIVKNRNRESLESRISRAPMTFSDMDKLLPSIPIDIFQYRRIDEENNPYLLILVENRPNALIQNELTMQINDGQVAAEIIEEQPERYSRELEMVEIRHSFQVYDDQWDIDQQVILTPELTLQDVTGFDDLVSVYSKRYVAPDYQSVSVELYNKGVETGPVHPLLPAGLRGSGRIYNRQPVPLLADRNYLEMADLMIGYADELPENYPFAYRVSNSGLIPQDRNLILHFEVYHLQPGSDGTSEYELTYRILPVVGNSRVVSGRGEISRTFSSEVNGTMSAQDLEIETQALGAGNYELQVVIEDLESGQEQSRAIQFRVVSEESS